MFCRNVYLNIDGTVNDSVYCVKKAVVNIVIVSSA
jgi:hypothetical protein